MRKLFVTYCLLLSIISYAQKNFQPAIVVTNDNRTLNGFINYKEWLRNPVQIEFKTSATQVETQNFTVKDILSFEIVGKESFERWHCRISMDPVKMTHLSTGRDTSWKEDTVFLKLLVKGKISLYSYEDELKMRFYIKTDKTGEPVELIYRQYYDMEESLKLVEEKKYIDQLISAGTPVTDDSKFANRIRQTKYGEDELVNLVETINNNGTAVKKVVGRYKMLAFIAGIGIHSSDFSLEGNAGGTPTDQYSFTHSTSPLFFGGVNLYVNPKTAKLFFQGEVSWFSNSHDGAAHFDTNFYHYDFIYHLKYSLLSIYLAPAYNLIKKDKLDVYLSAGLTFQFNDVSTNTQHETRYIISNPSIKDEYNLNPLAFDKTWYNYNIRAGVVIRHKVDISVNYNSESGNQTNYSTFGEKTHYLQGRVGYFFGNREK